MDVPLMSTVPLYEAHGEILSETSLPGELIPVKGRLSYDPASKRYYKGAGCPYQGHYTNTLTPDLHILGTTSVPYIRYYVSSPAFVGKRGIFRVRYQPQFQDPIGGCGPKERALLTNSQRFHLSAAEVLETIPVDDDLTIYVLNYWGGREPFDGNPALGARLLEYLITSGWNAPWDKNLFGDINRVGLVTDVADLFQSHETRHQFGTVYAYLYSLRAARPYEYYQMAREYGYAADLFGLPYVALSLLRAHGREGHLTDSMPYAYLIDHELLTGRNCAHLEDPALGDRGAEQYRTRFRASLPPVVITRMEACSPLTPSPISSA